MRLADLGNDKIDACSSSMNAGNRIVLLSFGKRKLYA